MPGKRFNPPVKGAARPETHVQFRLPPGANEQLEAEARSTGRSRNITAKLLLIKALDPGTYKAMVADLAEHPGRKRLDTPR